MELARRYLVVNHGITFASIPMAYDIFALRAAHRVSDGTPVHWAACANGSSTEPPHVGSLLIWESRGHFAHTGHVAVVVDVQVRCDAECTLGLGC